MTTVEDLCRAIDDNDRQAMFPLADLLMEQGDPRGEVVRWLGEHGKWPHYAAMFSEWWFFTNDQQPSSYRPWECILPILRKVAYEQGKNHLGLVGVGHCAAHSPSQAILEAAEVIARVGMDKLLDSHPAANTIPGK